MLLASPIFGMGLIVVVPTLAGRGGRHDPDGLLGLFRMAIAEDLIGAAVMPVTHGWSVDKRDKTRKPQGSCQLPNTLPDEPNGKQPSSSK